MSLQRIDIIPSHQIDNDKWDDCIARSGNSLIYANSWYLNALADNWHGIVMDDYDCVMPVPWRKKMGIRYCYDVPFIQQLGYFTTTDINVKSLIDVFLNFIKYGHYNFNYANTGAAALTGIKKTTNFVIDLADKETVLKQFTKGFMQSLQNSAKYDLAYLPTDPAAPIEMSRQLYGAQLKNNAEAGYENFTQLSQTLSQQNKCVARKIINKAGDTLSAVLLLKDSNRLYNIINATTEEGRKQESNYLLYAELINEFAGNKLWLDMEGSEIPGVKSFYKKLGATDQPYYRMPINNLPFPLKLFKA